MNTLSKTRQELQARRAEFQERLRRIELDRSRQTQPLSPDFADQATQRENDEVLDRLNESTRAELQQVEHAIAHLERGLYGFCEQCGERIDQARLTALLHATRCFDCATARSPAAARIAG